MKEHNPYKLCFFLCALLLANAHADPLPAEWTRALSVPAGYAFAQRVEHVRTWDFPDFTVDSYRQANGPGTVQRVFVAVPKGRTGKLPAVAVPFYYPEAMLGFDPATGTLDLSNLSLALSDATALDEKKIYTIATATTVTGNFASANIPKKWRASVLGTQVKLVYANGTILYFR